MASFSSFFIRSYYYLASYFQAALASSEDVTSRAILELQEVMERIALRIFFICMPLCASIVLFGIWFGEQTQPPEWLFRIAGTAFVIGLASFLTWFTAAVLELRERLLNN